MGLFIPLATSAEAQTLAATTAAPAILIEPQDQTAPVGSNVSFYVSTDSSVAKYQWMKNGTKLSGKTKTNLTLTKITPSSAGSYSVKVTVSKTNIISRDALLTVTPAGPLPEITTQPKDLTVAQKATAKFTVSVKSTTPKGYQWLFNGNPISKATAASCTVSKAQFTNAGEYSVIVTNWGGAVTSSAGFLTVVGELTKPTLKVTNSASKVYEPTIILGGKATDKSGILSVSYSWNGGDFQPVIGTTNWVTDPITLAVGSNVFKIKATDVWTNETVVTKKIYYIYKSPLTVDIVGSGKVTPNLNGKYYELGKKLSLKAVPAANCLFKQWEWIVDDVTNTSSSKTLSIAMTSNLVVSASFETNPIYILQGNYDGVISGGVQKSGIFRMSIRSAGTFSCKLQFAGDTYSFSGSFSSSGCTTNYLKKKGVVTLVTVWEMDYETLSDIIVGTVYYGTSEYSNAGGFREVYDAKTNPSPYAGRYTMVIPGTNDYGTNVTGVPMGDGYALVTIDPGGTISIAGKLADNSAVTASSYVSSNGQCPFYVSLAKGNGMLLGILDVSTNLCEVYWAEPAEELTLYPLGFTNYTYLNWSPLATPTNGGSALTLSNGYIVFSGGDLTEPLTNSLVMSGTNANAFTFNSTNSFTVNPTNGMIQGTFWHPVLSKAVSFSGIILQEQHSAHGFFTGTNGIGNVLITEQKEEEGTTEEGE